MPKVAFTARWVGSVKPDPDKQVDYFDAKPPGVVLRVSPQGRKSWCVFYRSRGRLRRYTMGVYPDLSLAEARDQAATIRHMVAHGDDPAIAKETRRQAPTVAELITDYLERYAKPSKRSWYLDAQMLRKDVLPAWGRLKAQDITRRDVIALLDHIVARGAPMSANRVLATLRKMFNWSISREILDANPCAQVPAPAISRQRDRVLTTPELRAIWQACDVLTLRDAAMVRLMILTGQRMGEIRCMRWDDLDLETGWWTIPASRSKNKLAHRVPLSAQAEAILTALYFTSDDTEVFHRAGKRGHSLSRITVQKTFTGIRERAGVACVIHDLRRTAASHMTGMGVSRLVVSKILNHVESGVTRVYDRHSYDAEKRQALDAWGRRVQAIVHGEQDAGNVISLFRETHG